jgi:transcriptional regulator GlxA family with amidase domain
MSGTRKDHHDAIWAAARYIRENPGQLFSVEALAERFHCSADTFSRLFKEIVHVTPKEFCIRTRMERAQTLLRESAMSIEQIASVLGYADVFFFSRQFKQRLGTSPLRWRKGQSAELMEMADTGLEPVSSRV